MHLFAGGVVDDGTDGGRARVTARSAVCEDRPRGGHRLGLKRQFDAVVANRDAIDDFAQVLLLDRELHGLPLGAEAVDHFLAVAAKLAKTFFASNLVR